MGKKGHSEEEILRVLRDAESGDAVVKIYQKHGISQQTFRYRCGAGRRGRGQSAAGANDDRHVADGTVQTDIPSRQKDLSAFVLTVGKAEKLPPTQIKGPASERHGVGGSTPMMHNGVMGDFTRFLQTLVRDRAVVDNTGLKGRFNFNVTFLQDDTQFNGHCPVENLADGVEPASILTEALQQELRFKTRAEKTPVECSPSIMWRCLPRISGLTRRGRWYLSPGAQVSKSRRGSISIAKLMKCRSWGRPR